MYSLIPNLIYESVSDLTPEVLGSHGIRVLLMDFDNTIVPYTSNEPKAEVLAWLDRVKSAGIQLCVVSNTKKGRAIQFCQQHGIDCITHANKPFQKGIGKAKEKFAELGKIALVGDQIYTDILGANGGNIVSVLIRPIHLHNFFLKFRHVLELPWIAWGRRRLKNEPSGKV